jgi:translation initiation factor 5
MATVNIPSDMIDPCYRYKRQVVQTVHKNKQGGVTIISNSKSICKSIARDVKVLCKYLSKKLCRNVRIVDDNITVVGMYTSKMLDEVIEQYINEWVLCRKCSNPETSVQEDVIRCLACGHGRKV